MAIKFELPSNIGDISVTNQTVTGTFTLDGYIINPSGATNNQVLKYNGSSFIAADEMASTGMSIGGAITSGTAKSILFVDASGNLGQNNTNLFFNYSTLSLQSYAFDSISGSDPLRLGSLTASAVNIGRAGINVTSTGSFTITDGAQSLTFTESGGLNFYGFVMNFSLGGPTITSPGTYDLYLWRAGQKVIVNADSLIPNSNNTKNFGSSSAQWHDGYFGGNLVLDGYGIDLSDGATANQVLKYDGAKFVAADTVQELFFDNISFASAHSPSTSAGSNTTGIDFVFTENATVTGVKFYWAGGSAVTIRCKLWTLADTTQQKTVDVNVSSAGIYTGTFSSSYSASPWIRYNVSMWETSGTNYTKFTDANGIQPVFPFICGQHIIIMHTRKYASGDSFPSVVSGSENYPTQPVYTVP